MPELPGLILTLLAAKAGVQGRKKQEQTQKQGQGGGRRKNRRSRSRSPAWVVMQQLVQHCLGGGTCRPGHSVHRVIQETRDLPTSRPGAKSFSPRSQDRYNTKLSSLPANKALDKIGGRDSGHTCRTGVRCPGLSGAKSRTQ